MAASEETIRFLLLLPSVPSHDYKTLKDGIFGETVAQVLQEVAQHPSQTEHATILEVAVACPQLAQLSVDGSTSSFALAQRLLATIYKLIGTIATRDSIDIVDSRGVDVRVILVAWSPEHDNSSTSQSFGPVVSLPTLAASGRKWQFAFGVEDDQGEAFVKAFVSARAQGLVEKRSPSMPAAEPRGASHEADKNHADVAVGGTFDHLHIGHKLLLTMTLFVATDGYDVSDSRSAALCITGDQMLVNKKHAELLESWDVRQQRVQDFADGIINFSSSAPRMTRRDDAGPNGKSVDYHYSHGFTIKCTELQDAFGPPIVEEQISALVLSAETRAGGEAINKKREEKGWATVEVFEVDVLHTDEDGETQAGFEGKLSSTQIRAKLAAAKSTAAR